MFNLWDILSNFYIQCATMAIGYTDALTDLLGTQVENLFESYPVISFLQFLQIFGGALFIIGIGFAVSEWAISAKDGNSESIMTTFKYIVLGLFVTLGFTTIPVLLLRFTIECVMTITANIGFTVVAGQLTEILSNNEDVIGFLIYPIYAIVLFVSVIKIFLSNLKRGGTLVILLLVCPFHIFSIPRGYTDTFFSWCKQVLALCLTTFIQNFLLALSLFVLSSGAGISMNGVLLSMGVVLSAFEAPRIMQQFGIDTSIKASASQAIFAVSGVTNIVKSFAA